ncbi:hypothetical protein Y1Q_0001746 [Alligator mississippiensis]|uniref:Uncharacterized protein n=1 Tax=Alligator mississippiensis TaxID=8496 RepID=A0A151P579_ALLMI|nr:hypothetical protein Y1Q_0001746 [Alligator mississippiensis]
MRPYLTPPGVISQAVRGILHVVREAGGHNCSCSVSMSYLEAYQEKCWISWSRQGGTWTHWVARPTAVVASEQRFYFDTLTTLNFATCSKQVVNKPFAPGALPEPAAEETAEGEQQQTNSLPARKLPWLLRSPLGAMAGGGGGRGQCVGVRQGEMGAAQLAPSLPPSSALLPLAQLEPSLRLEEVEWQQGTGHRGLPLLGTPKAARKALLCCLKETQAELEKMRQQQKELEAKEQLRAASTPEPPQAVILPMQQVLIPQKWASPTEDEGILVLKRRLGPGGTESVVPSWELTRCQEVMVRGHQKLLELLNHGSTRELLSLKRIGPRTAELLMA